MANRSLCLFVSFVLFLGSIPAHANETDQYNLPPVPLADIAPEVEAYVVEHIKTAIDQLNTDIAKHEACVSSPHGSEGQPSDPQQQPRPKTCGSNDQEATKLTRLRSPDVVARAVYDQLGAGNIFTSAIGQWLLKHKFEHEPSRYTTSYGDSIYVTAPVNYATISPTIRVYGVEFGTDKFDHLFQQGYTYYRKYNTAKKNGKSDADALKSVVAYGRFTENSFFGYTVSGVCSNADLAANMAGLKFYQNLTNNIQLGGTTKPAILKLDEGRWIFTGSVRSHGGVAEARPRGMAMDDCQTATDAEAYSTASYRPCYRAGFADLGADETLPAPDSQGLETLRPLISDHLNEALNPSNYLFFLYPVVKKVVKKRACPEWHNAFPALTHESLAARTAALTTWNGLAYGYKQTSRQVRLADVCFAEKKAP